MKLKILKTKTLFKRKDIKLCLLISICAAFFLLSGCSKYSETESDSSSGESAIVDYTCISNPENEKKIYVILKNYHGDYWKKVIEGINSASEEIDTAVYLGGIDNETDISGQRTLIDQAIDEGADGILLAPASSNSLADSCQKVKDHDIPLVLIDSSVNSEEYDTCYMTDNMEAGEMAAREMIRLLKEAGNSPSKSLEVGILLSSDTSQAMVNRVSGFLDYWANYAPEKWEIVKDIFLNGGDIKKAQSDTETLLKQNDQMKGIFGCNNTSTVGIANTILENKRTDIVMIGFDLAEETKQIIQSPDYLGVSLMQKQDQMGYLGMLSLDSLIKGEKTEQKYFDTGIIMVDSDYLMENNVS